MRRESSHFDGLRRDSVLFERVYSHCPMTLPSHVSMFTGSLPTEHGVRNNIGYRFEGARFRTLAEELRERGYAPSLRCRLSGASHFVLTTAGCRRTPWGSSPASWAN